MKVTDFLLHHSIQRNPFAEEDAQTDPIFKGFCIGNTYHPAWDKVYGNPADPSTSIVFGEKGSGKTAMRLQIVRHIAEFNRDHPEERCFAVSYDDLNPFLDQFRERLSRRSQKPARALREFRLWDHMDAILSLATTRLVTALDAPRGMAEAEAQPLALPSDFRRRLDHSHRRDLLLLAAFYDNSTADPLAKRWRKLRLRLHGWNLSTWWPCVLGTAVTIAVFAVILGLCYAAEAGSWKRLELKAGWWEQLKFLCSYWALFGLALAAGWLPWLWRSAQRYWLARGIVKHLRVINRRTWALSRILMNFTSAQLSRQPMPNKDRTDDRYAMVGKLQSILAALGYNGITVLVDRVDEPHLINGSADAMKVMLWPMLDNKFLKQPGIGLKFMLPIELTQFVNREDHDFYQRARLDKQNVIPSLEWSGPALHDVANARIAACAAPGTAPKLQDLLDESIGEQRLFDALRSLRVPRHVFRFLYRLIVAHCNKHSEDDPQWRISSDTFESVLAIYGREKDAADRSLGAV